MGHAREHQLALAPGLLDIFGHLVEGPVDLGHLARRIADRQAHPPALAELARGVDQALERQVQLANEYPRRGGGEQADTEEPAEHAPDPLPTQRVGVERHPQPVRAQARRAHPERGIRLDAYPHLGVRTELGLHLPLEDFRVGPVVFARWHLRVSHPLNIRRRTDAFAIGLVGGPIGPQRQGRTVAVLAIDHDVLVHHQVQQHQYLGEQHDDQHHPQGAGEEALREPERSLHRLKADKSARG